MGSLGLVVFAFLVWKFEPRHSHWMVLIAATVLEQFLCAVSVSLPSDGRAFLGLEGGTSVLEELLLPTAEHRGTQTQFFT